MLIGSVKFSSVGQTGKLGTQRLVDFQSQVQRQAKHNSFPFQKSSK